MRLRCGGCSVPARAERALRARRRICNPTGAEYYPLGSRAESQGEGKWLVRGVQLFEAITGYMTPRVSRRPE